MKHHTFLVALLAASAVAIACNNDIAGVGPGSDPATETFAPSLGVDISAMTRLPNGVYYRDLVTGTGAEVTAKSDTVVISYAGFLKNGTLFESANNQKLMPSLLVEGFKTGIVGMKVGGRRKLVIPSDLGYKHVSQRNQQTGAIVIPRYSTLIFDVDLLSVHTPAP